jgi:hypothetical protein
MIIKAENIYLSFEADNLKYINCDFSAKDGELKMKIDGISIDSLTEDEMKRVYILSKELAGVFKNAINRKRKMLPEHKDQNINVMKR